MVLLTIPLQVFFTIMLLYNMTGNGHIELLNVTRYNFQPSRARYYTNMTSRWGYHDGMSPEGGWFSRGRSPRENHPPEGDIPSWYPQWDVIFVLLYRTNLNLVKYQ